MAQKTHAIGRAKAALLFGQGDDAQSVIAVVTARVRRRRSRQPVLFSGPAVFASETREHLRETVAVAAQSLLQQLGQKRKTFAISVVNLAAASAVDAGLCITGFSADLPVLLALVSAGLKIPMPQNRVATGHVASPEGDLAPVRGLPAKLEAALADRTVERFICPCLDSDRSMQILSPMERQRAEDAIVQARAHMPVAQVTDVHDLFEECFGDEAVVSSSLRKGFFEMEELPDPMAGPVHRAARFLSEGNSARFWSVLEGHLLAGRSRDAGALMLARARYQARAKTYPRGLGRRLLQLVCSLPPATRRLKTTFPLLPMEQCLALGRYAAERDHQDFQELLDAAKGSGAVLRKQRTVEDCPLSPDANGQAALAAVLDEIAPETLNDKIGLPIDRARAAYVMDDVIVDSYDQFLDTITAFYLALLRHTESEPNLAPGSDVLDEAQDLVDRAFGDQGGSAAAWAEARDGAHGGMRLVLDAMTEQLKADRKAKHVNAALKAGLDPLRFDDRVAFVAALLDRIGPQLPEDLRSLPPARLAREHEALTKTYVESLDTDRLKQLLRRL